MPRGDDDVTPREAVAVSIDETSKEPPARVGRFLVLRELGSGGMGLVYSAYDEELDRKVAIKLLQSDVRAGTQGRVRLVREAQALARLSHPNVVHVYEVGEFDDQVYIVMEHVAGEDGRSWGSQRRSWQEVVGVYTAAGRGLAAAHRKGLIHRDFKPANFIVSPDGRTRVLDFGLARERDAPTQDLADTDDEDAELSGPRSGRVLTASGRLTKTGAVMGTPAYMPPEVFQGKPADTRSDQFSFCVAFYEAAYGSRPFGKTGAIASMQRTLDGDVLPAPADASVPQWLRRILTRGLRANPDERFESMDALLDEIGSRSRTGRRSLAFFVGGSVMAVAASAWWGTRGTDATCTGSEEQISEIWNAEVATDLGAEFEELGTPLAAQVWSAAGPKLDQYAADWVAMHRDNCEATRVRQEQSERVLDLRMACLVASRRALKARVESFKVPTPGVVNRVHNSIAALPRVSDCADIDQLFQPVELPPPEEEELVEQVRDAVALGEALNSTGRYEAAASAFEEAEALLEQITYQGIVPEYAYQRADQELAAGDPRKAVELLRDGYFTTLEQGNVKGAASLATKLVDATQQAGQTEAAFEWAKHADPLIVASGAESQRRRLLGYLARVHGGQGNLDEAETYASAALEMASDPMQQVVALGELAEIYRRRGSWTRANETYARVHEIFTLEYGEEHPETIRVLGNIGFVLLKQGRIEEARETLETAADRTVASLGANSAAAATILNNFAAVMEREGRFEEAIGYFQQVYEIRIELLGADNELTAHPINNMGNAYLGLDDFERATKHYSRARDMLTAALGPDHPHVAYPITGLGDVARKQERWEDAVKYYEEVARIREAAKSAPEAIGDTRLQIARALWHIESKRPNALALAKSELDRLKSVEETSPDLELVVVDLQALLDGNPEPQPLDGIR